MDTQSLALLRQHLDALHEQLERAKGQTQLAMAALAEASRSLPLAGTGLQPLMVLEADISARLDALVALRERIDEVVDTDDLLALRQQFQLLSMPGMLQQKAPATALLN